MDEHELIDLLKTHDERGLIEFAQHYGPLMRYIIAPILADPREREECLSDISVRVWASIDQFNPNRGSFTAWLSAITRNAAINRARGLRTGEQALDPALSSEDANPEEQLLKKERLEALARALRELPQSQQALFYRKYYYLQSTAQIAAELGTTERAVEGRLYRIKRRLRDRLGGDGLA